MKTIFASLSAQTSHRIELCHYVIIINPLVFSIWGNMWGFLQSYHPSFPSKFSNRGNWHESPFAPMRFAIIKRQKFHSCFIEWKIVHICMGDREDNSNKTNIYSALTEKLMTYRHNSISESESLELRLHVDVCIYLSEKCTIWIIARTGICFSDIFFSSRTNYSNKYKIIFFDLGVCQSTNGCCYSATAELTECYRINGW